MRSDAEANNQAGLRMKNKAIHYFGKYKEANGALEIGNVEKTMLEKQKQELEKSKKELERQLKS